MIKKSHSNKKLLFEVRVKGKLNSNIFNPNTSIPLAKPPHAMKIINNCVLLLKAEKSEETVDKFEVTLTHNNFSVKHLKTLQFSFKNLDQLKEKLEKPHVYSGLIFTTPRSVTAVKECLSDNILNWAKKWNYVVGETTYSAALQELGLDCAGKDSGNAANLAEVILKEKSKIEMPLLFPCGNLKTDTLVDRLAEENLHIEPITVYDTTPNSTIEEDFIRLTGNLQQIPEYFVYFSPSGVQSTLSSIEKLKSSFHLLKFVAIGPSTEAALKDKNIPVASTAAKPTPDDLLNAILS